MLLLSNLFFYKNQQAFFLKLGWPTRIDLWSSISEHLRDTEMPTPLNHKCVTQKLRNQHALISSLYTPFSIVTERTPLTALIGWALVGRVNS